MRFGEPRSVIASERAADQCEWLVLMLANDIFKQLDCRSGPMRKLGADVFLTASEHRHVFAQQSGLERQRRAIEAVDVNEHWTIATEYLRSDVRRNRLRFALPNQTA